jgi:hypothetical protein
VCGGELGLNDLDVSAGDYGCREQLIIMFDPVSQQKHAMEDGTYNIAVTY